MNNTKDFNYTIEYVEQYKKDIEELQLPNQGLLVEAYQQGLYDGASMMLKRAIEWCSNNLEMSEESIQDFKDMYIEITEDL